MPSHKKEILIGRIVNLNLLYLFPQIGARIMEKYGERKLGKINNKG
jgi:hypothetical protein